MVPPIQMGVPMSADDVPFDKGATVCRPMTMLELLVAASADRRFAPTNGTATGTGPPTAEEDDAEPAALPRIASATSETGP